ncbi:uncharacterized protein F4822DRAFT_388479 [Hypoxylon trugodes]|uniref:uncharacterized protein n=1 Tax=Hypoxylon trugodes TaxID=326681 RepID=UPI002194D76B|nr:uncharacterized protein F4822DRAFT_388479 [Hypoxylon trugodes]KAI1391803.1 hypothetical protein F4822DRAFT_388479 [Hypoxylon trugodes]
MIELDHMRFYAPSGCITPGGPSQWHICDVDQRRIISVTMDEEQEDEDTAIQHLKKHLDTLGPDVFHVHLSPDGDIISTSTDPMDDQTWYIPYPPEKEITRKCHGLKEVLRSELLEIDRISMGVDHVSYIPESDPSPNQVIFKYYFTWSWIYKLWNEMNLWMRLPRKMKYVAKFDRLVVDEPGGRVLGFTNEFIKGGTVKENISRGFKLTWLKQLTEVVDELNLKHGIAHQDISPRNLLIDADDLKLFDFNYSGRIGEFNYSEDRNDVKGVIFTLYEIITRDDHFRCVPHDQQDSADVEALDEWVKHPDVTLDHPVSDYRSLLNNWVKGRREGKQITHFKQAPEYITWPEMEKDTTNGMRRDKQGDGKIIKWERPMQSKIKPGARVFADGRTEVAIHNTQES